MWKMSQIELEDMNRAVSDPCIPWSALEGKTVLISGATGLIGCTLAKTLLFACGQLERPIRVIALVRDRDKAADAFSGPLQEGCPLVFHQWQAEQPLMLTENVDLIFHCASQTSSRGFVQTPVETIQTAYQGTRQMLELAREKQIQRMVYLSTMEVYGTPQSDRKIDESYVGAIDVLNVRSCYPESKRLCENLCVGYVAEYQVPVSIARLTQTFGPGVAWDDGRVFAEFARCVVEKRDIVLHTKGATKRNYLYTADAVRALLAIALAGEAGQAYNVANEETYCTIFEMANMVAEKIGHSDISVKIESEQAAKQFGYAPELHMNLDAGKLKRLGWRPAVPLQEMFERMIAAFEM